MELIIQTERYGQLTVNPFDLDKEVGLDIDRDDSCTTIYLRESDVQDLRDYLTAQLIEIGAETPKTTTND